MLKKITCCLNTLKTNFIEKLIILLSIIGLILSLIGMIVIPWSYTSNIMEVIYLISMVFFIYSLFISCLIKYSRIKKNENILSICYTNSFIEIIICILSFILNIFISIGAIPDLKNKKSVEYIETYDNSEVNKILNKESKLTSKGELSFSIFSIITNLFLWIVLFILWSSEYLRLKYRIENSFNDYLSEAKNTSIQNIKNVVGHDKYGFPIYEEKKDKDENLQISKSQSENNNKLYEKYDKENNVLKYSYKEKYRNGNNSFKKPNSVDEIHKIKEEKNEKYIEKYIENGAPNPYYSNFDNKTILNISNINNSINPGY